MPSSSSSLLAVLALLFVAASSSVAAAAAAADEGPPDWTFMVLRDGEYDNGACDETLDALLWEEVGKCVAAATGHKVARLVLFGGQQSDSEADENGLEVVRRLGDGLDPAPRSKVRRGLFADDAGSAAGPGDTDAGQHRRLQTSFCFAKPVKCSWWSYPNGVCCRSNPSICVSSTKNPCKRRRLAAEEGDDEDFDYDDEVDAVDLDPYAAEAEAIQKECTATLQKLCHKVDKDGSGGGGCLGTCESLQCSGYIFE